MTDVPNHQADSDVCDHPADAIRWNPYNAVTQCHRCGHVIDAQKENAMTADPFRDAVVEAARAYAHSTPLRPAAYADVISVERHRLGQAIRDLEAVEETERVETCPRCGGTGRDPRD